MSQHDVIAALPTCGTPNAALLRKALIQDFIYLLSDATDPTTFNALDADTGALPKALAWHKAIFWYDATSIAAHDGVTVLVTADGYHYIAGGSDWRGKLVVSRTIATPPTSPAVGDAYIIPASPTGAWAGFATGSIALRTGRGWENVQPFVGQWLYVEGDDNYVRFTDTSGWVVGPGALTVSANSIPASALIGRPVRWQVENQTTNAPPGSPAVGVAYIVGPAPTGAWAGQAGKIAILESGTTFTFYAPRTGELAYDKALGKEIRYSGSGWVAGADAFVLISTQVAAGIAQIDVPLPQDNLYDAFEIRMSGVKPATSDAVLTIKVGTGATPTFQSAGYRSLLRYMRDDGTAQDLSATAAAFVQLTAAGVGIGIGTGAGRNLRGTVKFENPDDTDFLNLAFEVSYNSSSAGPLSIDAKGMGLWATAGAVTALRFVMSAGNIAAGRFSLYGLRKS